jgi:hypothetical protein
MALEVNWGIPPRKVTSYFLKYLREIFLHLVPDPIIGCSDELKVYLEH